MGMKRRTRHDVCVRSSPGMEIVERCCCTSNRTLMSSSLFISGVALASPLPTAHDDGDGRAGPVPVAAGFDDDVVDAAHHAEPAVLAPERQVLQTQHKVSTSQRRAGYQ